MKKFLLLLLFPMLLFAKSYSILPKESVHKGDYFATGEHIEILGVVKGDLYVFGAQVIIDGQIEGDVIASGGTITISGKVGGNARLAGGQIELNGDIGRNVTLMGGNIEVDTGAYVNGNGVLAGGNVSIAGHVNKDLRIMASNVRFSGDVGGDVNAQVGHMHITSKAAISGSLEYSSSEQAVIEPGAQIGGKLSYHPSKMTGLFKGKWKQVLITGSRYTALIMNFVFSFVIGWLFLKVFTDRLKGILTALKKKTWKCLWLGLLSVLLLPLIFLILLVTILGMPFAFALLAISVLGFYSAKVFSVIWMSSTVFRKFKWKRNSLWMLFWGLLIFFLISKIPFFGAIISFAFTLLGLGAIILGKVPKKRESLKF